MDLQRLSRKVILGFRYFFLPIPSTAVLLMGVGEIIDWSQGFQPALGVDLGPKHVMGQIVFMMLTMVAQAFVGAPSLVILDVCDATKREYLVATGGLTFMLSLVMTGIFHRPELGDTYGRMFPWVLLFFGVPMMVSYLLAWWLRSLVMGKLGDATRQRV